MPHDDLRKRPDPDEKLVERIARAFERIADQTDQGGKLEQIRLALLQLTTIALRTESKVDALLIDDQDPDALRKLEERVEKVKQIITAGRTDLNDSVDRNQPPA